MSQTSKPRQINIASLIVAAAGILVIFVSAPDRFPSVPPGPIILAVAAVVVAFAPRRWTPAIGVVVPLFIFVGGIVTLGDLLSDPENVGVFAGVGMEMLALVTAIASGAIATVAGTRATVSAGQRSRADA